MTASHHSACTASLMAPEADILYLVPDFYGAHGGIARYCRLGARALSGAGFGVTVLALMDRRDPNREWDADICVRMYVPAGGSRTVFSALALKHALARPDLVIAGHPNLTPLALTVARATGARSMGFMYGVEVWDRLRWHRRRSLRAMDARLAISNFTADRAVEANGLDRSGIRILPNCLDPALDRPPRLAPRRGLSILTVSRLARSHSYKGCDTVIRSLPELLREFPELVYHIVGDGDASHDLQSLAASLDVGRSVRFHGCLPDEELSELYEEAAAFVMPSRREGFGFVFLEAMAHGTPAVGGNMDATPEVIEDGVTGLTVDPTSAGEVSAAVVRLLRDEQLRNRMGAAARSARQRFAFDAFQSLLVRYVSDTLTSGFGRWR